MKEVRGLCLQIMPFPMEVFIQKEIVVALGRHERDCWLCLC